MTCSNVLEHPLKFASISTGHVCVGSEYYGFGLRQPPQQQLKQTGYDRLRPHPALFLLTFAPPKTHQGTSFFNPFFFLLVDSFLLSPLVPFCVPSCAFVASALAASAVWSVPAGAASVLEELSAVPAVAAAFAVLSAAGGVFSFRRVARGPSFPSPAGGTLSPLPRGPALRPP